MGSFCYLSVLRFSFSLFTETTGFESLVGWVGKGGMGRHPSLGSARSDKAGKARKRLETAASELKKERISQRSQVTAQLRTKLPAPRAARVFHSQWESRAHGSPYPAPSPRQEHMPARPWDTSSPPHLDENLHLYPTQLWSHHQCRFLLTQNLLSKQTTPGSTCGLPDFVRLLSCRHILSHLFFDTKPCISSPAY